MVPVGLEAFIQAHHKLPAAREQEARVAQRHPAIVAGHMGAALVEVRQEHLHTVVTTVPQVQEPMVQFVLFGVQAVHSLQQTQEIYKGNLHDNVYSATRWCSCW